METCLYEEQRNVQSRRGCPHDGAEDCQEDLHSDQKRRRSHRSTSSNVGRSKGWIQGNDYGQSIPIEISEGDATVSKLTNIPDILYYYPCCPPEAIINIKEFYLNKYVNYMLETDKKFVVSIRNWNNVLREWKIKDFEKYYSDINVSPYFNAYSRNNSDIYYDVQKSTDICVELLNFQFAGDDAEIFCFLETLVNVLDKKIPKLNTIAIKSPHIADKNFFFDAIVGFFLNYGMFGTANKTNNFSWADGAGKRVVLWNEPNYDSSHIKILKELLGGDTTRVNVKYKNPTPLQGPPVIMLSNNDLSVFHDVNFSERLKLYVWEQAGFLKNYKKKINPLCLTHLLKYYNIKY